MKEKLFLPSDCKGDLWLYNKERFLDHTYQSFLHRHDELELNLVVRGRGVYLVEDRKIELQPNTLLWLFPGQEHLLMDRSLDFEMWILVMRPETLRELCTDENSRVLLESDPAGNFCGSLSAPAGQKLASFCRETSGVKSNLALFNVSLGYILLSAWAAHQTSGGGAEKRIQPAIEKTARRLMEGNGQDDLGFLAQEAGMSATSLSRQFKRQMGVSLSAFRNRCRVEHFIELYGGGQERTMLDAALEAGFGSYAQFFRVFKAIMGGSPAEYRKSLG